MKALCRPAISARLTLLEALKPTPVGAACSAGDTPNPYF